jgi:hypothetical protein
MNNKDKVTVSVLVLCAVVLSWLLGYVIAIADYKPKLEKANGELAITQAELAQAKSELATFQAILKTLVEGENPEGMRSPR